MSNDPDAAMDKVLIYFSENVKEITSEEYEELQAEFQELAA